MCPQGKSLGKRAFIKKDRRYMYGALQKGCQQCPVKTECLPPGQKRRYVALSMYHSLFIEARERNKSPSYREEMVIRRTAAEGGVFASLDRLGWARSRLRGLWKVDCEGYISALAHNLKKAVRRLGTGTEPSPPVPVSVSI